MRAWTVRWTWCKTAGTGLFLLFCAAALLKFPEASACGVRRGLAVCADVLVPTLFPFLVVSGVLIRSGLSDRLAPHLQGWTRRWFGLPGTCAAAILVGFVGGYPAGASATASLVASGRISVSDGRRLLRFCVNAGPAFLIGTVGVGCLGSPAAGLLLMAAGWLAALCIGVLGKRSTPTAGESAAPPAPVPFAVAVADSVNAASRSLIGMSGFVVLATSFLSILDAAGLPSAAATVLSGLTEVSVGCLSVCRSGPLMPLWLGLILGWGGLSVHGQIAAMTASLHLLSRDFFLARAAHAVLTGTFSLLLFRFVPISVSVAAMWQNVQVSSLSSVTGGAALLGLCAVWLLTVGRTAA